MKKRFAYTGVVVGLGVGLMTGFALRGSAAPTPSGDWTTSASRTPEAE